MTKLVKVYVSGRPISLSNGIKAFGFHGPLEMKDRDIFACLAGGAKVVEIVDNGKREVILNFANYNKNNNQVPTQYGLKNKFINAEESKRVENKIESIKEEKKVIEEQPQEASVTRNPVASAISEAVEKAEDNAKALSAPFSEQQHNNFNNRNNNYKGGKNNRNRH